jgi:hypothetical protein
MRQLVKYRVPAYGGVLVTVKCRKQAKLDFIHFGSTRYIWRFLLPWLTFPDKGRNRNCLKVNE